MCGGGGTTVNDTGLDESQFSALRGGQRDIQDDVNDGFGRVDDRANEMVGNMREGFTNVNNGMNTGFRDTNDNINSQGQQTRTTLREGFTDAQDSISQGFSNQSDLIRDNTQDIRGDLSEGFNETGDALREGFADTRADVTGGFNDQREFIRGQNQDTRDSMRDGFSDTAETITDQAGRTREAITGGFQQATSDIGDGFVNVNQNLNGVASSVNAVGQGVSGVRGVVDGIATDMDAGFTGVNDSIAAARDNINERTGERFDSVDTRLNDGFSNVRGDIASQTNNINAASAQNTDRLSDEIVDSEGRIIERQNVLATNTGELIDRRTGEVLGRVDERMDQLGRNLADVKTSLSNSIGNADARSAESQTEIAGLVERYGNQQADQFGALTEGQSNIASDVAGVSTQVEDFQGTYTDNERVASQLRGDINANLMEGNADTMGAIGALGERSSVERQRLSEDIANVRSQVERGAEEAGQRFSDVARDIATGTAEVTEQGRNQQLDFSRRISQIKDIIETQGDQIPQDVVARYSALTGAFDDSGRLIARANTATGTVSRAIDSRGNLFVAEFDANGQRTGQTAMNIDQMLNAADQVVLSPNNSISGGLGSPAPFIRT